VDSNVLALLISSVVALLFARLIVQASKWTRQRELLTNFFEDDTEFMLAIVVYIPLILLIGMLANSNLMNSKVISISGFIFGASFWLISYNFTTGGRAIFSQLNGFSAMPTGLADWWTIPDLVDCKIPTDCDRLGRPPIYGHGWKLLLPLANDRISLVLGAAMAGFVCYSIGKLAHNFGVPIVAIMFYLSPSLIFSLERGQSDIFVVGLIFIFLNYQKSGKTLNAIVAMFLVTLKPFFVVAFLKNRPSFSKIFILAPIFIMCYLFSIGFNLSNVKYARLATIYPPEYQIGIDQIPSLIIQIIDPKYQINPTIWKGIDSYKLSLIVGITLFMVISAIAIRKYAMRINFLKLSQLSKFQENNLLVFSALYLIVYLSGSQVAYKSWVVVPIIIFTLSRFLDLDQPAEPSKIIFLTLIMFGGFAIDIWILRSIGGFLVAVYCVMIVAYFYRDNYFFAKLGKFS
jgi:hypothetical protein